jgi:hypothetical protein
MNIYRIKQISSGIFAKEEKMKPVMSIVYDVFSFCSVILLLVVIIPALLIETFIESFAQLRVMHPSGGRFHLKHHHTPPAAHHGV